MKNQPILLLAVASLFTGNAVAKIDLVTLPNRETVQLTIYNSADLTLVREQRALTLREGANRLQFSWANTLIDPTSLGMLPLAQADKIDVSALVFPPRVKDLGLWTVDSEVRGKNPMEISYLTSGLSWRAFYMGTLTSDETHMRLQGYVRVTNNSGEDYENAQTRLIVGKVNLIDEISVLAQRGEPYGRPGLEVVSGVAGVYSVNITGFAKMDGGLMPKGGLENLEKKVIKEGLSEYFLYTIEGEETIPNGWSKRLPSFDVAEVPVVNLYKFDEQQFGRGAVVRFLSFANDEEHKLGETPIPGGALKVYRSVGVERQLAYEGQSSFKYIPVKEDVELNLGAVGNVRVIPTRKELKFENYEFKKTDGNVSGWDELQTWQVLVKNTRDVAVKVQVERNFGTPYWALTNDGDFGEYEKRDMDSVRYTLELPPESEKAFFYALTLRHGTRAE